jgi:hypothetical protein
MAKTNRRGLMDMAYSGQMIDLPGVYVEAVSRTQRRHCAQPPVDGRSRDGRSTRSGRAPYAEEALRMRFDRR